MLKIHKSQNSEWFKILKNQNYEKPKSRRAKFPIGSKFRKVKIPKAKMGSQRSLRILWKIYAFTGFSKSFLKNVWVPRIHCEFFDKTYRSLRFPVRSLTKYNGPPSSSWVPHVFPRVSWKMSRFPEIFVSSPRSPLVSPVSREFSSQNGSSFK